MYETHSAYIARLDLKHKIHETNIETGEMVQRLRAPVTLVQDPRSIPSV